MVQVLLISQPTSLLSATHAGPLSPFCIHPCSPHQKYEIKKKLKKKNYNNTDTHKNHNEMPHMCSFLLNTASGTEQEYQQRSFQCFFNRIDGRDELMRFPGRIWINWTLLPWTGVGLTQSEDLNRSIERSFIEIKEKNCNFFVQEPNQTGRGMVKYQVTDELVRQNHITTELTPPPTPQGTTPTLSINKNTCDESSNWNFKFYWVLSFTV